MEHNIFFECVSRFIHEIHMYIGVVRIHFPAAFVHRHEHRFDTRGSLGHQAGGSSRCNRQAGDVSSSVFLHVFVQLRVSFLQAVDERIVLFTFRIVDFKRATFLGHVHRRTVSFESDGLVHFFRKFGSLFCAVTQSHGSQHVTFSRDTYARTASQTRFAINLFPQVAFCSLHFHAFRVRVYLFKNPFNLFQFQIDDVVHDALCQCHMLLEQFEIKVSLRSEWIYYV